MRTLSLCFYFGLLGAALPRLVVAQTAPATGTDNPSSVGAQDRVIPVVVNRDWTDTGLFVTQGQSITVTATGTMNWFTGGCNGRCLSTPAGIPCPGGGQRRLGLTCLSLIGKIGRGKPFEVGALVTFTAPSDGEFFLGPNDDNVSDNTGNWQATVSSPTAFATAQNPSIESGLSIPPAMHFCAVNCMTLQWSNGRYVVTTAGPGNSGTWTLEKFTRGSVVLHRHDPSGFDVFFTGEISKDGNELVNMRGDGNPVDRNTRLTWGTALTAIPGSNEERDRAKLVATAKPAQPRPPANGAPGPASPSAPALSVPAPVDAGQASASKNSTSVTASQPAQKNQTPVGELKVNLTGSWTAPPVVNRAGQKVALGVTIVQKGGDVVFILHQPGQPNLIMFKGRFETADRISGQSRSPSNSIDNPDWTPETFIVVDATHLKSAITPISFTKAGGPESITAASATPYKEAKGYLRDQPFNLNGVWQGVEKNADLFRIVIVQKDDGEFTMRVLTVSGPFFRGKYVKNPTITGLGIAKDSDLKNVRWVEKSVFIDDPDHIRYNAETMVSVLFRVTTPPPHDLTCDDQNSNHVARKFATDRGRIANRDGDSKAARCWLTIGANEGYAPAQSLLAALLLKEPEGTEANYKLAFEMATKSAQQGDIAGQLELASLYRDGKGTAQDLRQAQFWTQKAQQSKEAAQWRAWNTKVFLGLTPLDIAGLALKANTAIIDQLDEDGRRFSCADGHVDDCRPR